MGQASFRDYIPADEEPEFRRLSVPEYFTQSRESSPVAGLEVKTPPKCPEASVITFQGFRKQMEDSWAYTEIAGCHVYAVFDGHGGSESVRFCAERLPTMIKNAFAASEHFDGRFSKAYVCDVVRRCFVETERQLLNVQSLATSQTPEVPDCSSELGLNEDASSLSYELYASLTAAHSVSAAASLAILATRPPAIETDISSDISSNINSDINSDISSQPTSSATTETSNDFARPPPLKFTASNGSGTCALVALLMPDKTLIVANCGDCVGLLVNHDGTFQQVSQIHRPCLESDLDRPMNAQDYAIEINRIERSGLYVENGRVQGQLAVSRSIGDTRYKGFHIAEEQHAVTCVPTFMSVDLNEQHKCLLLFSDGIADALSNSELASLCSLDAEDMMRQTVAKSFLLTRDNTVLIRINV